MEFLFVYLWLYGVVFCFVTVTVFLAMLSYALRSVNALNWKIFIELATVCDVVFASDRCEGGVHMLNILCSCEITGSACTGSNVVYIKPSCTPKLLDAMNVH